MEIKSHSRRKTRRTTLETETQSKENSGHSELTTERVNVNEKIHAELSDTVLNELDSPMDVDNTLESTVTESFLDDTYDTTTTNSDDSITELKMIENSTEDRKFKNKQEKKTAK